MSKIIWRVLVVDDKQADEVEDFIVDNRVLEAPDHIVVEKCTDFAHAIEQLQKLRIDLVILDLKDDSNAIVDEELPLAGEKVFEEIRQLRFVPIVFHTAYAHKIRELEKPFVKVVNRDDPKSLRRAIAEVFQTGLPKLLRHIEAEQRDYMWNHIEHHWRNFLTEYERTDFTYLLARRLANALERDAVRRFLDKQAVEPDENADTIYPIEMYVYPARHSKVFGGDILKTSDGGKEEYWIVITPSCDLEQGKAANILLASCLLLNEQPEFLTIQESISQGKDLSKTAKAELMDLIRGNRNTKIDGKRVQPERYFFLPGTFFLPDLVVDFQALKHIPVDKLSESNRIVSLDSPFSEAILARFARYYGRLGTPDIEKDYVYNRIIRSLKPAAS